MSTKYLVDFVRRVYRSFELIYWKPTFDSSIFSLTYHDRYVPDLLSLGWSDQQSWIQ